MLITTTNLNLAKEKGAKLTPNSQIRLTADEKSYEIYNIANVLYIGANIEYNLKSFFKNKTVFNLSDKDGKIIAKLQRLY